tara:strand:- start:440 stop:796 length:357 start_codon:yes stop_codon:yes gene_type:complete
MSVTLDGNTLDDKKIIERTKVIYGEYAGWKNGAFASTTKVYGTTREWITECKEYGMTWASGTIVALQTILESGDTVTFTMSEPPHNISVSVKIKDITNMDIDMEAGRKSYTLLLAEVA